MKALLLSALIVALTSALPVHGAAPESPIESVLSTQAEAWNRGDIPGFVDAYSPECIFVGKLITRGRAQLLARYQKRYPTRDAMGHLTFSALDVHFLTAEVAIVTGEWHLERSGAGGSPVGGLFSLVFHREGKDWKIALDHTS